MGAMRLSLGRRLQQLRKAAHLTQEELAARARIDSKYLGSVERGEKSASLDVLERLILALDVEPYELFLFAARGRAASARSEKDIVSALVQRAAPPTRKFLIHLMELAVDWASERKS